jgi:AcrR family transcriptional regulator
VIRPVPAALAGRLYAAAGLIAERGLDDTKIEDIAEATGIPKATLYYYFPGKQEILAFLLADMLTLMADEVAVAADQPGTARERLTAVVNAQLRVMTQHPEACQALVGDLGRAGRLPDIADAIINAFHQPVEQLLKDGAADGSLRPVEDPSAAASTVFGAVTMTGLAYLIRSEIAAPDAVAAGVVDVLLTGLAPIDVPKVSTPRGRGRRSTGPGGADQR